ncbi:MAG: M28 family metallopeptidase [Bellilinea sp.]
MDESLSLLAALRKSTVHLTAAIDARPAGSPAERQAQDWLAEQMSGLGYRCEWQSFAFAPLPSFFPYYSLAAVWLIAAVWLLPAFPWAAVLAPLWVSLLPNLRMELQYRLPRTARSQNLLCLPERSDVEQLDLLLVAHVDTARALPYAEGILYALRVNWHPILTRAGWIAAFFGALILLRMSVPPPLLDLLRALIGVAGFAYIGLDYYDQRGSGGAFTRGANDNASGVAVLLELARWLAEKPDLHRQVGLLFSGAEEAGLFGARHAAANLKRLNHNLRVLSVDMVGSGDHLRIFSGVRGWAAFFTDPGLNRQLQTADPMARLYLAMRRSGDFEPFVRAGFRASGIETSGAPRFWRAYHTLRDDLPLLEIERMAQTCHTLQRWIEQSLRGG